MGGGGGGGGGGLGRGGGAGSRRGEGQRAERGEMEEPRARAGSDGVCVGHPAGPSEPQHPQGSEGRGEALPFVGLSQGIEEEAPFECPVCLHLMFAPTTLHCGHSLCNSCLVSCMQHAARCPVCRVDLPAQMSSPATSLALQKALEKLFPKEYAARAAEESARSHYSRTAPTIAHHSLPLFVLEPLLPRQQMKLHIFEPRYVTLTQRVMASADRCFGMVAMDTTMPIYGSGAVYPRPASVGVLVRVLACQPLPYGRFLVHIEGVRRFRTLRTWEVDGYLSAQVAWYADHNFEDSDEHVLAQLLGAELLSVLEEWSAEVCASSLSTPRGARRNASRDFCRPVLMPVIRPTRG